MPYCLQTSSHFSSVNPLVALTMDHYTPQEYVGYYNGSFGLLTVITGDAVHRVGKVIAHNRRATAILVCREIGYSDGYVIRGPWQRLPDGTFSSMTSLCDGHEPSFTACSRFTLIDIEQMFVDYISCGGVDKATVALYPSIKYEIQRLPQQEGIPYLTLSGITARIVLNVSDINVFCRHYGYQNGSIVTTVRAYEGFVWHHLSLNCISNDLADDRSCMDMNEEWRLLHEWYDGPYVVCCNESQCASSRNYLGDI